MTLPNEPKKVPLRVRLPFTSEAEFIERYRPHVAAGGIFLATRATKTVGTLLSLEIVLADGTRLMRAEGVVERLVEDDAAGPRGMLVRFLRIDAKTRALLDRLALARSGLRPEAPAMTPSPSQGGHSGPGIIAPEPSRSPIPTSARVAADAVLGIDLGTTTCRVAVLGAQGPRLLHIPSERGVALPSAVALNPAKGRLLVGSPAQNHRLEHPEETVVGFKRMMGRRARSTKAKEIASRVAFAVVPDMDGDVGVELGGKTYALSELASCLLAELKHAAQEALGQQVARAVVCVPAWYSDHQRGAMLEAGRLAGLEILTLLNEPSAIAMAFGYGRGLARKRVLIYDFGGGTFDTSVVEITGDDLEVVSTGGDLFLGGMDLDVRLAQALADTMAEPARKRLLDSRLAFERVKDGAERAKIALSDVPVASIRLPFVSTDEQERPVDMNVDIERAFLEARTADLLERTMQITQEVLAAARLAPAQIDEIIAVGGQSRAPAIRQGLERLFARQPRTDVDPQGAVALGAALYGAALVQREQSKHGLKLSEVLPVPIGIAVRGGGVWRIFERNTRLPAEKSLQIPVRAEQALHLAFVQGEGARAEENEYLGALNLAFRQAGEASVECSLSVDGRLSIVARSPSGERAEAQLATLTAPDSILQGLLAQAPLPPDSAERSTLISGIKRLFGRTAAD